MPPLFAGLFLEQPGGLEEEFFGTDLIAALGKRGTR
jgi:hypothetical protein